MTIIPTESISDQAEAIFQTQIKPRLVSAKPEDFLATDLNIGWFWTQARSMFR